nr:MAG TPA: hypothetical protein [Caudoviricetes sp.]
MWVYMCIYARIEKNRLLSVLLSRREQKCGKNRSNRNWCRRLKEAAASVQSLHRLALPGCRTD